MVIVNYMFLKSGPGAQNKKNNYVFPKYFFCKIFSQVPGPLVWCGWMRLQDNASLFDLTLLSFLQLTQCAQPLQVLRQRQLSNPAQPGNPGLGLGPGGGGGGNSLYGAGAPISSSSSWPTNPIHIKQEIQIPQVQSHAQVVTVTCTTMVHQEMYDNRNPGISAPLASRILLCAPLCRPDMS